MKESKSALLVGVGGQGAILTAKVLVNGLMKAGYDVKMSEVHGMSQRGGSVSTQVHWGEKVWSPVIGKGAADIIVAFEKMEAVRYADFLKPDGVAVINDYEMASSSIAAGLCEYPQGCLEAMQKHYRCLVLNEGPAHGRYRLGSRHRRDRAPQVQGAEPEGLPRGLRRRVSPREKPNPIPPPGARLRARGFFTSRAPFSPFPLCGTVLLSELILKTSSQIYS